MLAGLSTRRYPVGLEPVGSEVEQAATATSKSKSAISRRCADLVGLELVALMIDGCAFR